MVRDNTDSFLGPHGFILTNSVFNAVCDKLVEKKTGTVDTGTVYLCQNKTEWLWDLVFVVKLYSWWETKFRN